MGVTSHADVTWDRNSPLNRSSPRNTRRECVGWARAGLVRSLKGGPDQISLPFRTRFISCDSCVSWASNVSESFRLRKRFDCCIMTTHLAFLRAVNVGGTGNVAMADLRAWLTKLGFADARTLLQSGNLVFRSAGAGGAKLEQRLETEAKKALGLDTDFFVRTTDEWQEVIARNPFPDAAKHDPSHLVVVVLKAAPTAAQVKALQAAIKGRETVSAYSRHAYIVYPDGIGRSKLTLPVIEKALGTRGTGRNWNTALKMAALAAD